VRKVGPDEPTPHATCGFAVASKVGRGRKGHGAEGGTPRAWGGLSLLRPTSRADRGLWRMVGPHALGSGGAALKVGRPAAPQPLAADRPADRGLRRSVGFVLLRNMAQGAGLSLSSAAYFSARDSEIWR